LKKVLRKAITFQKNTEKYVLDEDGRNYFHKKVLKFANKTSEIRLCRYLCGQDENLDTNTNFGYYNYQHKLKEALNKMGISKEDRKTLLDFFALLRSFPYSGLPINHILWNINGEPAESGKLDRLEINENAIRFLVHMARRFFRYRSKDLLLETIKQDKDFIITANFLKDDNKPIRSIKKHKDEMERFMKMINGGEKSFPKITILEHEKKISINVSMTEQRESKAEEKSN
jgi:hypothetical protein